MKKLILNSFFLLIFIPIFSINSASIITNMSNSEIQNSDLITEGVVDVSIVKNIYVSKPDAVEGEELDIYGIVRNNGDFIVSSYILFTVKNATWKKDISGQKIDLRPDEEQFVKTSWIGIEGSYEIIITVKPIGFIDDISENNVKSTFLTVYPNVQDNYSGSNMGSLNQHNFKDLSTNNLENQLDILIYARNTGNTLLEIKPGDSKTLDLGILSNEPSEEFRVIVGGITNEIKVKPDRWTIQLLQNIENNLQIEVSTSKSIGIGNYHEIELILYRSSNPEDIVEKTYNFLTVTDYSEVSSFEIDQEPDTNYESSDFRVSFSIQGLNEVNPPIIENISMNPEYPTISQNVTISADIIDDSIIINSTLFYSFNNGSTWSNESMIQGALNSWSVDIVTPGYEVNATYYIQSYDNFTNSALSSQLYFIFDNSTLVIEDVTNPGIVSTQDIATITAHLTDNVGINNSNTFLYYSYDNSSFFMVQMAQLNGSTTDGYFNSVIPATTNPIVYYFINASDLSGWSSLSSTMTYTTDSPPNINSITIDPLFPHVNISTTVYANLTDDTGFSLVNLDYSFNGSSGNVTMSESMGLYLGIIPATVNDTYVNFTITIIDNFGHNITSSDYSYYSDGILPKISSVSIDDNTPNYLQNVTVTTEVTDINELRNVTLYYSYDGGNNWFPVNMTGTSGAISGSFVKDVLLVSHSQYTNYLIRNGYTFDSITESAFSSITESTLRQYRILILEPNWSLNGYTYLRNGLVTLNQTLDNHSLAVSIRVAGNQGSQANIDLLGTYYTNAYINAETIIDSGHPIISGLPWGGNTLVTSYFNSWGYTDHGYLSSLPTSQQDYTEILQNANGISMFEYSYKGSHILVDTLTSIDGGWGSGNDPVADNFINYLNYTFYEITPGYRGIIPAAPANTVVNYYINATDMANNSIVSEIFSYFSDGSVPQITGVTQTALISELDSLVVNATITDNQGLDNATAILVYTYNNITFYQTQMTQITGNETNAIYQGVSPATSQPVVYYHIEILDSSGLIGKSGNYSYFVDRLPVLNYQFITPSLPSVNDAVTINASITDDNGISLIKLYYNYLSVWYQDDMDLNQGIYQGTIPATLTDANVDYYISVTDTYGHQVNTTIFTYYSDGLPPSFSSITHSPTYPSADASTFVQAYITDLTGVQNATLAYSTDGISWTNISMFYSGSYWYQNIPPLYQSTTVYYYIIAYDLTGQVSTSNQYNFNTDNESPLIFGVTDVGITSELSTVSINATVSDNYGVNTGNIYLYYSYDNISWFSTFMSLVSGDSLVGTYSGILPATNQETVYYYILAYDLSGRSSISVTKNYLIDNLPNVLIDRINPAYPSPSDDVTIFANASDDFGIIQAVLYYYYDNNWQQITMSYINNQYSATVGFTNTDTQVSYYVSIVDTYGHMVNTTTQMYYTDGMSPLLGNISFLPTYPRASDNVSVTLDIYDNQAVANATLYYTTNGTWIGINVDLPSIVVTGRDPLTGYYYGTTQTTDYDSGELGRLAIYVYSSDSDTLYVTLWGHRIDNGVWEQFYYSGSIGSGNLPVFTWTNPIYDQWRIQIYDSEYNDNFYYSFDYSNHAIPQLGYSVMIPATNVSGILQFYFEAVDMTGNKGNSSIVNYYSDADPPNVFNITQKNIVPAGDNIDIESVIQDEGGINEATASLYYSYDNSSWFNIQLIRETGTIQNGTYHEFIPASVSETTVYYYIYVEDLRGQSSTSAVYSYDTIDFSIVLQSPAEFTALNGTLLVDIDLLVYPNTSIVEISLDQGTIWTNMSFISGDLFTYSLNTSAVPEGVLEVWVNVTLPQNASFVKTYSFFIDRSNPQIIDYTNIPVISGSGQSVYVVISDGVITPNMTVLVEYTFDNLSWYQAPLILESQTTNLGTFTGSLPQFSGELMISYYISVVDELGWFNQTLTINSLIDYKSIINNVSHLQAYVNSNDSVTVYVEISDDFGIQNVTLFFYYGTTNSSTIMNIQNGTYVGTIPATISDTNVTYFIRAYDSLPQLTTSGIFQYYSDGIDPNINDISNFPLAPNIFDIVDVYIDIDDNNPIQNATLFYSFDGNTWSSVEFNLSSVQTVSGQDPQTGYYYGQVVTTDHDSGPLSRLSIYTYSSDSDTISVTLWGMRVDTGTWEQFYTSSILGTGYIPEFNWNNPIYDQWRIQIYDSEYNDNFYYSYEYDIIPGYLAQIPSSNADGYVDYYVVVSDMANRTTISAIFSYYTDGLYPSVTGISDFDPVSQFVSPRVFVNISDNTELVTPILYYSTNEITWYSQSMILDTGNMTAGRFYADIPPISSGVVAYYINASDLNGLVTSSITRYYVIDTQPNFLFITHYPTEISLNSSITVTSYISDDYGIVNTNLFYWIDGIANSTKMQFVNGAYQAIINPVGHNANVDYLVNTVDTIGHSRNSSITSLVVDGLPPTISFIQYPLGNLSLAAEVAIVVLVQDNAYLDMTGTFLYYSYDNVTWIKKQMQLSGGTSSSATFAEIIPEIATNVIYYYVTSFDSVGLQNSTSIMHYFVEIIPDSDGDGIGDWTEINVYNSDPNDNDTDNDGLYDYDEVFSYYTNITNPDTDADGMPDGWEIENILDPLFKDSLLDSDNDGLQNIGEYLEGTDPNDADSDNDGMGDGWEVSYSLNPLANDANLDPDNDGLSNIEEYNIFTNPKKRDTEDDGMDDRWEHLNNLNPLTDDANLDPDKDGLDNLGEYNSGTNPQIEDTDADGMPDGWEVLNLLNPLVDDASLDSDTDNLTNLAEYSSETDPNDPDTDNDGMPDGWEVINTLNPLINDAGLDTDGDGLTNLEEYNIDSDPNDPNDPNPGLSTELVVLVVVVTSLPLSYVAVRNRTRISGLVRRFTKK